MKNNIQGLRGTSYPGKNVRKFATPKRVEAMAKGGASGSEMATTPLGLLVFGSITQGSSFLATLGFKPESLWDSPLGFPKGFKVESKGSSIDDRGGCG